MLQAITGGSLGILVRYNMHYTIDGDVWILLILEQLFKKYSVKHKRRMWEKNL